MEQLHKDRLLRLADFLWALPPKRFYFNSWVGGAWGGLPDLSCGTTACGLGWATAMPEFQELGFCLSSGGDNALAHPRLRGDNVHTFFQATCFATETIFGLTADETEFLFTPTDDETDEESAVGPDNLMGPDMTGSDDRLSRRASAKRLAKHIRDFVERQL